MSANGEQLDSTAADARGSDPSSPEEPPPERPVLSDDSNVTDEHEDGRIASMLKTPSAGAAISGTIVLGAAAVFGVLETAVAAGAAYFAYRLLRKK